MCLCGGRTANYLLNTYDYIGYSLFLYTYVSVFEKKCDVIWWCRYFFITFSLCIIVIIIIIIIIIISPYPYFQLPVHLRPIVSVCRSKVDLLEGLTMSSRRNRTFSLVFSTSRSLVIQNTHTYFSFHLLCLSFYLCVWMFPQQFPRIESAKANTTVLISLIKNIAAKNNLKS